MAVRQKEMEAGTAGPTSDEESESEPTTRLRPNPGGIEEMEMTKIPIKTDAMGYPEIIGKPSRCCKTEHLKIAVIAFNSILVMLGFVLLSLAIWIRVDPAFWEYNDSLEINDFYKACYMFMVVGLIILTVGLVGCCGAINGIQWMLIFYLVVFVIIFLIELTAVILIWHAPFNNKIRSTLEDVIKEKIQDSDKDESARYFIDFVQAHLECCGSVSSNEYTAEPPASCNSPITMSAFQRGCASVILNYLQMKAGIIGGISLLILLFQALGIAAALSLLLDIRRESGYSI